MVDAVCIHEELLELEHSMRSDLQSVANTHSGGSKAGREETIDRVTKLIGKHKILLHQLRIEVRGLEGQKDRNDYERKYKDHQAACTALNKTVCNLKRQTDVQADPEDPMEAASSAPPDPSRVQGRIITGNTNAIQENTIKIAESAARLIPEIEATAGEVTTTLSRQTNDLRLIKEDLNTLSGNVQRAKREMNAFMRRMMSDKLVMVFMCLVAAGILAMIIVRLTRK